MSRIEQTFQNLNRTALVAFITAGDPDYGRSLAILKSLPGAGVDIIELGMPFSDPMADGPVIQLASQRALKNGANMKQSLQMVREFRTGNQDTPIILMGYANPVLVYGIDKFMSNASKAGVDGLIIVDMPPEEDGELRAVAEKRGLDLIRLITPTTDVWRLPKVLEGAGGFLYYVSITGVTGTAKPDISKIGPHIEKIRQHTNLPVAIGFGIKTPEDVANMAKIGDAVVVGSAIVQTIADHQNSPDLVKQISKQVKALADAVYRAKS